MGSIKLRCDEKTTYRHPLHIMIQVGVEPKIGGKTPKWMVKIMENPMKNGWFGGKTPLFSETSIFCRQVSITCSFSIQLPTSVASSFFQKMGEYWQGHYMTPTQTMQHYTREILQIYHTNAACLISSQILPYKLLMEEIRLTTTPTCMKPCKWDKLPYSTGDRRISEPSTVLL